MRCWIDTDVGGDPDDSIALWCAVRHPEVEVVGVSTVDGDIRWRAEVARELFARAGAPNVPVNAGPPPPDLLGADALLAIGPWTHVAALDRLPPKVVLMGGTLDKVVHRGEEVWLDWNVEQDRAAAERLVARDAPEIVIVPLDVSATMICTSGERAAIAAAVPSTPPIDEWNNELVLHDPLAFLVLAGGVPTRVERRKLWIGGVDHDVVVGTDAAVARHRVVELCS